MNLTFYGSLNEEQKRFADLIAARAKAAGVPPELAVAVAYRESRLNPNVGRGDAGEIGIMQVKPGTGKELGFPVADLQNAERNIDAGVAYLKKSLDAADGNQKLAAVGYNAGVNHPFFSGGDLPGTTKKYVQDIDKFGGFGGAAPKPGAQAAPQPPAPPAADDMEKRLAAAKAEQEQRMAQMAGAGAGAALAAGRGAADVGRAVTGAIGNQVRSAIASMPQAAPEIAPGQDQISRILQGTTQDGLTGRARSSGFNVETAQQAARANEAERVAGALQQSGVVRQTAPQVFANAPGMTSSPSGVLIPREMASTAPPKPSGLEQITKVFAAMAGPTRRVIEPAIRYGAPPLALASAAGEGMRTYQQATSDTPDYAQMALSGLGAIGSTMSAFPPTAPVGMPLAVAAPVGRDILEKFRAQQARTAAEGVAPPTPEEEAQASRAAFGIYPRAASRPSPLNSPGASGY